jgi:hypothetical protein
MVRLLLERGASSLRLVDKEQVNPAVLELPSSWKPHQIFATGSNAFYPPVRSLYIQCSQKPPARKKAVRRLGWEYFDVPFKWSRENHAEFPATTAFRQRVTSMMVALSKQPGHLSERLVEALHERMGLTDEGYQRPST